jgi:hypothetical protein
MTQEQIAELLTSGKTTEEIAALIAAATTTETTEKKNMVPVLAHEKWSEFVSDVLTLAATYGFTALNVKQAEDKNNGKPYANLFIASPTRDCPIVIGDGNDKHTAQRFNVSVTLFDFDCQPVAKLSKTARKLISEAKASGKTVEQIEEMQRTFAALGV